MVFRPRLKEFRAIRNGSRLGKRDGRDETYEMTGTASEMPEPDFLYRYRSLKDYSREDVERILAHRQIRCSSSAWFNDPFDCKVSKILDVPEETKSAWLRERIRRQIRYTIVSESGVFAEDPPDLEEQVEQKFSELLPRLDEVAQDDLAELQHYIDNCGVLSLSELRDDILMWSHYAGGHRGICLMFRSCALKFPIGELKPPPYRNAFHKPEEVNYSKSYPGASLVNSPPWEWYRAWLMTKSSHWCYEREWRVILRPDQPRNATADSWQSRIQHKGAHGWHPLPPDALAGVILGCEISREDEQQVREWLGFGGAELPLFRAEKKPGRFELRMREIK